MSGVVFYCENCKKSFAGENYQVHEKPRCPKCNNKTLFTGVSKEAWLQKTKEERQEFLAELIKEEESKLRTGRISYIHEDDESGGFLDGLYADIGKKIKSWAKVIFICEAIAAVIGALIMLAIAEEAYMVVAGLAALVGGPIVAWVSSWILYGFGELVDKTCANEKHTQKILELMWENDTKKEKK